MHGLFLLYGLSFIPISAGEYSLALEKARSAAFIQSGVAGDWEQVRSGAEKRVPPVLHHAALAYGVVAKRELSWRGRKLDGVIRKDGGSLLLHLEW